MSPNLVTVFRVENKDGIGPYKGCKGFHSDIWADCTHTITNGRPDPVDDEIEEWYSLYCEGTSEQYVFGFLYLEHLHAWFSKLELQILTDLGFSIQKYEIDEQNILLGNCQVAFKKK